MNYQLSQHAEKMLAERGIAIEWMERTLRQPTWSEQDPNDPQVMRHFRIIPEFGERVLRVVVNEAVEPRRVVSVFFDRTQKGQP